MSNENPYKGDTFWGDFKGTALGGFVITAAKVLYFLLWVSIVGILIYGCSKALYYTWRKQITGKPLPDYEDFPRGWYIISFLLVWLICIIIAAQIVPKLLN